MDIIEFITSLTYLQGDCIDEELVSVESDLPVLQGDDDPLDPTRSVVQQLQGCDGGWEVVKPQTLTLNRERNSLEIR